MTIPKQMIEAGAKAHYDTNQSRLGSCEWPSFSTLSEDAQQEYRDSIKPAITAALAAMWSDDMDRADRDTNIDYLFLDEGEIIIGHWWGPQESWVNIASGERCNPTHFIDPSIFPLPPKEGE